MNVAIGAMFFPIMYQAAVQTGYEPVTFLVALMIAVNTSFATPIGAPANMMVYAPAGSKLMRWSGPLNDGPRRLATATLLFAVIVVDHYDDLHVRSEGLDFFRQNGPERGFVVA